MKLADRGCHYRLDGRGLHNITLRLPLPFSSTGLAVSAYLPLLQAADGAYPLWHLAPFLGSAAHECMTNDDIDMIHSIMEECDALCCASGLPNGVFR